MNEQEIDALEGRQLDLAIEKYVFGNEKPPTDKCWTRNDDGTWWSEQQDCIDGEWLRSWEIVQWPPEYHDSDWLAFKVVDKIECKTVSFMLYQMTSHKSDKRVFEADFFNPRTTITIGANISRSRPLAICRAALKVVCNGK